MIRSVMPKSKYSRLFRRIWLPENLYFIDDTKYVKAMWSFLGNDIARTPGKLIQFFFSKIQFLGHDLDRITEKRIDFCTVWPVPKLTNYYYLLNCFISDGFWRNLPVHTPRLRSNWIDTHQFSNNRIELMSRNLPMRAVS